MPPRKRKVDAIPEAETAKRKRKEEVKKPTQSKKVPAMKGRGSASPDVNLADLITDPKWKDLLSPLFEDKNTKELQEKLNALYTAGKQIFPPSKLMFNAFNLTPLDKIKVVILGQDPYHDDGQAMGLSFSVPKGVKVPPSLKNIYKELERTEPGFNTPDHGCLEQWARNGVLLLNATLTVEAHQPNSHSKLGWQKFTDTVIKLISENCDCVAFILWGGFAHKKEKLINAEQHIVIKTAHPSPLSIKRFKDCDCFRDCNAGLKKKGITPINWSLD